MIIQPEVEEGIAQRTCMVGGARIDIHLIADTVVQFTFYGDSRPLNSKSILATPDRIVVVGLDVARDLGPVSASSSATPIEAAESSTSGMAAMVIPRLHLLALPMVKLQLAFDTLSASRFAENFTAM